MILKMADKSIGQKGRIEYFDLAKGICIIMVVLYHLAECYDTTLLVNSYFKLIRMPLYFFLSGVFFKTYEGFFGFLKRKTNKLLIPFSFWYLFVSVGLSLLLYYVFGIRLNRAGDMCFWDSLTAFWTKENFPNDPIWFLLCLFHVNILFYLVYLVSSRFKRFDGIAIFSLSMICGGGGLLLWYKGINLPAFFDSALTSMPFFCFGYLIRNHTKILVPNRCDKYLIASSLALLILVGCMALILDNDYSLKRNWFTPKSAWCVYPCGMLGTLGVILFAKKLKRVPIVSMFGRYSIMILVTHRIILEAYAALFQHIGIPEAIAMYLNLAVTLLSYLLLIPFMRRFMPHVTAQKDVINI